MSRQYKHGTIASSSPTKTISTSPIASWSFAVAVAGLMLPGLIASAEPPEELNPYPETLEEIATYREHIIRKHHDQLRDYPKTVIEISTLSELVEYAGESGVHVRMKPGVYSISIDNYQDL